MHTSSAALKERAVAIDRKPLALIALGCAVAGNMLDEMTSLEDIVRRVNVDYTSGNEGRLVP